MTRDDSYQPETSAQKSLQLIEQLAEAGSSLGVSELARRTGGSRGTVHKRLAGMVASGWVEQDPNGRYRLTLKVARLGNAALEQAGLGERIRAILAQIAGRSGETISIAALADDAALIVQRAESSQVLHADIRVGTRVALDGGASGLVLAAFAIDPETRTHLRARGVPVASEEQLAAVADAGYAATIDQLAPGISAISIPLYDSLHYQTVALTISGPTERLDLVIGERFIREGRELIARAMRNESAPRSHGAPTPRSHALRRPEARELRDSDRSSEQ